MICFRTSILIETLVRYSYLSYEYYMTWYNVKCLLKLIACCECQRRIVFFFWKEKCSSLQSQTMSAVDDIKFKLTKLEIELNKEKYNTHTPFKISYKISKWSKWNRNILNRPVSINYIWVCKLYSFPSWLTFIYLVLIFQAENFNEYLIRFHLVVIIFQL